MNKFKVGELVEQIKNVAMDESPFCVITEINNHNIFHRHLNKKGNMMQSDIAHFKHIPKLKKLLLK